VASSEGRVGQITAAVDIALVLDVLAVWVGLIEADLCGPGCGAHCAAAGHSQHDLSAHSGRRRSGRARPAAGSAAAEA
jgi:Mrp family chromosome partitioning ATPase